jgi:hypothetical protein
VGTAMPGAHGAYSVLCPGTNLADDAALKRCTRYRRAAVQPEGDGVHSVMVGAQLAGNPQCIPDCLNPLWRWPQQAPS